LRELVEAEWLGVGEKGHTGRATLYYGRFPRRQEPLRVSDIKPRCLERTCDACGAEDVSVVFVGEAKLCEPCMDKVQP
jgi:hypothetical protein